MAIIKQEVTENFFMLSNMIMMDGSLAINERGLLVTLVDKKKLQNGNSFILGVSGSGKSFLCKEELALLALRDKNADIIAIDPERELLPLIRAFNGEIINVSSTSGTHINALDINKDYTEKDGQNPVILKSEFIMSLCEQLMGDVTLGATQKSIIDRCAINVYKEYQANNYKGEPPTLKDFRQELLNQNDPIADEIALDSKYIVDFMKEVFETNPVKFKIY